MLVIVEYQCFLHFDRRTNLTNYNIGRTMKSQEIPKLKMRQSSTGKDGSGEVDFQDFEDQEGSKGSAMICASKLMISTKNRRKRKTMLKKCFFYKSSSLNGRNSAVCAIIKNNSQESVWRIQEMENQVRVRFAPSPTGYVHIGGLRTALYNYLFARNHQGAFVLRIEDTDRTRFVEGALENLIRTLKWAGIDYDEGPFLEDGKIIEKGDYGPYIQSERVEKGMYREYVEQLLESGKAYYCFCTKERLDHVREQQKADGLIPRYDGLCRGVSLEEARKRVEAGEKHVIRLMLPADRDIEIHDAVKGLVTINTRDMDDQVLIKSDGYPTYHLAVVVDDHTMGITHVIRGDEWVPSTPKHVYLYEAFGWKAPEFVHLPIVLNAEHKKLSKRNDDVAVEDFRRQGYLPDALVNFLALVGWSPEGTEEIFTMDQLIEQFNVARVSSSGAVFDRAKLDWINGHYIRALEPEVLRDALLPFMSEAGIPVEDKDFTLLLTKTFQDDLEKLSDIGSKSQVIFDEESALEEDALQVLKEETASKVLVAFQEKTSEAESIDREFAKTVMKAVQKETGVKGKSLFMPVRVALTGRTHGPELANVIELLGKEKILRRVERVRRIGAENENL